MWFLGVEFFFIVSGYLMAKSVDRDFPKNTTEIGAATWKFLGHKLAIILPSYFVAWVIGFVANQIINKFTAEVVLKNLINSIPAFFAVGDAGVPCYQVLSPTWYVSAMLIAMLFIYPFLLMKGQMFRTVASPIIAVISYGYLAVKVGILATIEPLEGEWVHTGLFRAFGGLSIGTIVFEIAENVLPNKRHSKVKLTAIELGCFICALLSMSSQTIFRPDFIVVLLLGIAVTLSFSGQTFTNKILPNPPRWLGKLSLSIYLIDAPVRTIITYLMPGEMNVSRYVPCIVLTIVMGIITMLGGDFIKWFTGKKGSKMKKQANTI